MLITDCLEYKSVDASGQTSDIFPQAARETIGSIEISESWAPPAPVDIVRNRDLLAPPGCGGAEISGGDSERRNLKQTIVDVDERISAETMELVSSVEGVVGSAEFGKEVALLNTRWLQHLRNGRTGGPDFLAAIVLGEIVYWWRPSKKGNTKLTSDVYQLNCVDLARKFWVDEKSLRGAVQRLADFGVITKRLVSIRRAGKIVAGKAMVVRPVPEKLAEMSASHAPLPTGSERTSDRERKDIPTGNQGSFKHKDYSSEITSETQEEKESGCAAGSPTGIGDISTGEPGSGAELFEGIISALEDAFSGTEVEPADLPFFRSKYNQGLLTQLLVSGIYESYHRWIALSDLYKKTLFVPMRPGILRKKWADSLLGIQSHLRFIKDSDGRERFQAECREITRVLGLEFD